MIRIITTGDSRFGPAGAQVAEFAERELHWAIHRLEKLCRKHGRIFTFAH